MSVIGKMSVEEEQICRLCLKMTKNNYEEIDAIMKQIFDVLSLKMDLNITKDPVICQDCVEVAKKCLNFKSTCIDTEEIILSYSDGRKKTKLNINVIYKEREHMWRVFDEDLHICRFCMARLERGYFVHFDTLMNDNMFEMLSEYLTEMDLNVVEDPIICATCRENLQCYFKFVLNCLDVEGKIIIYCREERADSMGQVKLGNILHFLFKDILECSIKNPEKCVIKEESNTFEHTEDEYLGTNSGSIKLEEVNIKEEEISLMEDSYESLSEMKLDKGGDMPLPIEIGTEVKLDIVSLNAREYNTNDYTYQKNVQANIVENSSIPEDVSQIKEYVVYSTDRKENENDKIDFITNIYSSDAGTSKYKTCISKSKEHNILKKHKSICEGATEMKEKNNINGYVLIGKESEKIMYKCLLCDYESKQEGILKRHMVVHKDRLGIKIYKCSLCAYEAKFNSYLKNHMLAHKNALQKRIYTCPWCAYKAKYISDLKKHKLIHQNASDMTMYKCSLCFFETKLEFNLKHHMLIHTNTSKINMYKSLPSIETQSGMVILNYLIGPNKVPL